MNQRTLWRTAAMALAGHLACLQAATTYTFQEGVNGYAGIQDAQIRGATPERDDGALNSLSIDGGENHVRLRFEDLSGYTMDDLKERRPDAPPLRDRIAARLR